MTYCYLMNISLTFIDIHYLCLFCGRPTVRIHVYEGGNGSFGEEVQSMHQDGV